MGILASFLAACAGEHLQNLGVRYGTLAPCPSSPNYVSSRANDERHRIVPLCFSGDPDAAFTRLKHILPLRPDTKIVKETDRYLRVEFRTLLGFVDDGEFLLDTNEGCIHVRSASRLGYSDLGKNRARPHGGSCYLLGICHRRGHRGEDEGSAPNLKRDGVALRSEPGVALYDPPWTLPFMRRNEVLVEIEGGGTGGEIG